MSAPSNLRHLSQALQSGRHRRISPEPRNIAENDQKRKENQIRRASVAAIIRVVPQTNVPADQAPCSNLEEFLSADWVKQGKLEIGFIKRATKDTDRWSGQVGFPGGKQENGETDEETAERETLEEIGLDLRKGFVNLGQLNDREIRLITGKTIMVLCTFVYLQLTPETPEVTLQTSEVALFQFVPLSIFEDHLREKKWIPLHRDLPQISSVPFSSFLGLSKVSFPSVVFPRSEEEGKQGLEMILWGLTFQITSELLQDLGLSGNMNRIPMKYQHADLNAFASLWRMVRSSSESVSHFVFVFGATYVSRVVVIASFYSFFKFQYFSS